MKTFPMFIKVQNRTVLVIGGGEQAAQKARLVLKTEADLVLVSRQIDPELADLVNSKKARWLRDATPGLFTNAALVFVATGCKGADASWHARAKAAGALVNVVDFPELCDAITPSIVDRDPVVVAIGTEGTAPVLGRRIKTMIEQILHSRIGDFAELAGRLRSEVARRIPTQDRREFWRWVFGGAPWSLFSAGRERTAAEVIKKAITNSDFSQDVGRLSIVTRAVSPDALTLGIVERMQDADVLFVCNDVPDAVTELARRDAKRVLLPTGENVSGFSSALLTRAVNEARSNAKVVFLSTASCTPTLRSVDDVQVEFLSSGGAIRAEQAFLGEGSRQSLQSA